MVVEGFNIKCDSHLYHPVSCRPLALIDPVAARHPRVRCCRSRPGRTRVRVWRTCSGRPWWRISACRVPSAPRTRRTPRTAQKLQTEIEISNLPRNLRNVPSSFCSTIGPHFCPRLIWNRHSQNPWCYGGFCLFERFFTERSLIIFIMKLVVEIDQKPPTEKSESS